MSILGRIFIPADVRAVVASLDNEPEAWRPNAHSGKLYDLTHRSDLYVWASNRPYGVEIRERCGGRSLFGDVTLRSTLMLSPGHWALSNAIGRWKRRNLAPPPPRAPALTAREILAQS